MTIERDKYHNELEISRNKVKMILNFHLNSIADAIILDKSLILPIPTRSGFLEYHKNREKFGTRKDFINILINRNLS
jgi:hypothetical protein